MSIQKYADREAMVESLALNAFNTAKTTIEYDRLEEELTDKDIDEIAEMIGFNLKQWTAWLRHYNRHKAGLK